MVGVSGRTPDGLDHSHKFITANSVLQTHSVGGWQWASTLRPAQREIGVPDCKPIFLAAFVG